MKFSRCKCECANGVLGDGRPPFQILIIQITGDLCPFRPAIKFTNKMQTPVKSVCTKVILLHCDYIIDPKCCQGNWEHRKIGSKRAIIATVLRMKMGSAMVGYYPLPKRGSIDRHCNVFDLKKHCGTTTFFCDFEQVIRFLVRSPNRL